MARGHRAGRRRHFVGTHLAGFAESAAQKAGRNRSLRIATAGLRPCRDPGKGSEDGKDRCPPGPETLLHAIVTLHENIRTGEILRRREATGGGAGLSIEQIDGQPEPTNVTLGASR